MSEETFKTLSDKLIKRGTKYFYFDKNFDDRGMDYKRYIKLRYNSVNFYHIKNQYSLKGWFILWYLMCNAKKTYSMETTIRIISEGTRPSLKETKEYLLFLHKIKTIYLSKVRNITYNTPLKIIITYNNDEYYENFDDDNKKILEQINKKGENITDTVGYRAIPIDYIQPIMDTIDYKQFAILSILFTRYSYYSIKKCIGEEGTYYLYNQNYYAFPTYEQISKYTGISESVCLRKIKQLIDNPYKIIDYYNDHIITTRYNEKLKKFSPMAKNNVYYIYLFQQPEYVYYHLYKVEDKKDKPKELKQLLNNKNFDFEKVATDSSGKWYKYLTDQDYIKYYHKYILELFEKYLKDKNKEGYTKDIRPEKIYLNAYNH